MTEKKKDKDTSTKPQKLSYEQLEAYAAQTTEQAKRILQENQMLKKALYDANLKEVEIALKCLDHADMFSTEFITTIIGKIEEIMTPSEEEDNKEK